MNLGTKGYCKILTTSEPCHFTVQEFLLRSIGKHDRAGTHGASEPMSSNGRYHLSDITHALVIPAVVSERVAPPFHTTQPIDPVSGLLSALIAQVLWRNRTEVFSCMMGPLLSSMSDNFAPQFFGLR